MLAIEEVTPRLRRLSIRFEKGGARVAADADDLMAVASIALLRARRRFDPGKGGSWRTFALICAKGAMQDELRRLDHVPRIERARAKVDGRPLRQLFSLDGAPAELLPTDFKDIRS